MSEVIIGVDLGGTNIKSAVVTREREVLCKDSRPTEASLGPDGVMDNMAAAVEHVLNESGISRNDVLAVGIGSPGPLNWQTGIVYETPNLPGWVNVHVADGLAKRTGFKTYLDNDANSACYGEYWLGAGQGTETMCVLTLGTGVGGGVVVFGKLLRGIDGSAAELGHMVVQRDGRLCGCGSHGCLEAYASVTGLKRTAVEAIEAGRPSILTDQCEGRLERITGKMVSDAAEAGDDCARWVMQETGRWIGLGCGSLINIFNPERIVLCGGMIAAGDLIFGPICETAKDFAFEVPAKRCQILPAGLNNDAGVIGAAGCALARYDGK